MDPNTFVHYRHQPNRLMLAHIPSHSPIQTLTIKPPNNKHVPPPNTPQRPPSAQTPNPSPRSDAQHFDPEQTAHDLQIRFRPVRFNKRY